MVIEEPSIEVYGAMADDFMEGCLILDSGASLSVSSLKAADDIQLHWLERDEPGVTTTEKSTKTFSFANGGKSSATFIAKQPITSGLLAGQDIDFHLIYIAGNRTAPLLLIKEMTRLKMIIDFAEGSISYKDALPAHKWSKRFT